MNDLERLKRAEESEPMAVLVIDNVECCDDCPCSDFVWIVEDEGIGAWECHNAAIDKGEPYRYMQGNIDFPDWCKLRKAIGIIEPGCRVRYFGEDEP